MKRVVILSLFLLSAGCGVARFGPPCTKNADCPAEQTCVTSAPGGFCTKVCNTEGITSDCPGDALCVAFTSTERFCSPTCTQNTNCRPNYVCTGTSGALKACKPE